jgi:hypothetical protein
MINKSRHILLLLAVACCFACSPYRGFSGVTTKGMKRNKLPSQELRQNYEKMNRKARKAYRKEQKRAHKRLGTKEDRNSTRFSSD